MRKIKTSLLQVLLAGLFLCLPIQGNVLAAPAAQGGGTGATTDTSNPTANKTPDECISGKVTSRGDCAPVLGNGCSDDPQSPAGKQSCLASNPIVKYLKIAINTLAAGVAVVVTAMIIYGGIQYIVGGDNTNVVADAKKRITNALIALIMFMFIYALLQWLVPGGVL